jgi:sec-independent protein translocase protein TatA
MAGLTGWHLLILVVVLVLLFGAKRLPDMARAVGQSARIFKGEIKSTDTGEHTAAEHTPVKPEPPSTHIGGEAPHEGTTRPS